MDTQRLAVHDPSGLGVFALMAQALMAPYSHSGDDAEVETFGGTRQPAPASASRRGLLQRLERWFWVQQQRDLEAYLAQASDIHDLEMRMRNIERSGVPPYY